MAAVSVSAIAAFFSGEEKLIKKGENALKSGRLSSFAYDASAGSINAVVQASMKDKTYKVRVSQNVSLWVLVNSFEILNHVFNILDAICTSYQLITTVLLD